MSGVSGCRRGSSSKPIEPPPAGVLTELTDSGFLVVVDGEAVSPSSRPRRAAFMDGHAATRVPLAPVRDLDELADGGRWACSTWAAGLPNVRNLEWPTVKPVLAGRGSVALRELVLPEDSLAVTLAALGGREPTPWNLGTTTVDVQIADGWLTLERVVNDGAEVTPPLAGRVGLDGALDLGVDLMPLVRAYGGGVYAAVARTTSSIPLRVQGTVDAPDFEPPTAAAVAKGLLGGLVHRALTE